MTNCRTGELNRLEITGFKHQSESRAGIRLNQKQLRNPCFMASETGFESWDTPLSFHLR